MAFELCYTSAPKGLLAGTSGYCTVKTTRGIPLPLRELLESLSQYRHVIPPNDPNSHKNPVNYSSLSATVGGRRWQIISRIQAAGLDHTRRGNFYAHHLALDAGEARNCSPTKVLAQTNLISSVWDSRVEELSSQPVVSTGTEPLRVCSSWKAATGDAGWAGTIAERVRGGSTVYVAYHPGMNLFPLICEVAGLLSEDEQHDFTFSSYFNDGSRMVECGLRCVVAGSEEHSAAAKVNSLIVDLTRRLGASPEGALVDEARTGRLASVSLPPSLFTAPPAPPALPSLAPELENVSVPLVDGLPNDSPSLAPGASIRSREQLQPRRPRSAAIWAIPTGIVVGVILGCSAMVLTWYFVLDGKSFSVSPTSTLKNGTAGPGEADERHKEEVAKKEDQFNRLEAELRQKHEEQLKAKSDELNQAISEKNRIQGQLDGNERELRKKAMELAVAINMINSLKAELDVAREKLAANPPPPIAVAPPKRESILPEWKTTAENGTMDPVNLDINTVKKPATVDFLPDAKGINLKSQNTAQGTFNWTMVQDGRDVARFSLKESKVNRKRWALEFYWITNDKAVIEDIRNKLMECKIRLGFPSSTDFEMFPLARSSTSDSLPNSRP